MALCSVVLENAYHFHIIKFTFQRVTDILKTSAKRLFIQNCVSLKRS